MGGSSSAATTKPLAGYQTNLMRSLNLNNGLTNAAITTGAPEVRTADIDYLQDTVRREAILNALGARQTEEELNPETAAIRKELPKQVLADLSGGPSRDLSNMWLKSGLEDAVATGADTGSGFARSAIVDSTRRDFLADRDRVQAKAGAYLADNPEPVVGLDPGSIASIISQTKADNANSRDQWKTGILNLLGSNNSNLTNVIQQAGQMEMARRTNNTNAINSAKAANSSMFGNMASAGIGAAGAIGGGILVAF